MGELPRANKIQRSEKKYEKNLKLKQKIEEPSDNLSRFKTLMSNFYPKSSKDLFESQAHHLSQIHEFQRPSKFSYSDVDYDFQRIRLPVNGFGFYRINKEKPYPLFAKAI